MADVRLEEDVRVAELASLLDIDADAARQALAEAGGDPGAAVELVRAWAATSRSAGPDASQGDVRVAELASLLDIDADSARCALAEAGGDPAAAVEVVRAWAAPPGTPGPRSGQPAVAVEQRHEWAGGSSVLTAKFEHLLEGEPPTRGTDGARELRALRDGAPPRDSLPLLCELARSHSRRGSRTRSFLDRAQTETSLADISLHTSPSSTPAKAPQGDGGLPEREAQIVQGAARLAERLEGMGLRGLEIADDGNCLFRACAAQLYRGDAAAGGGLHPLVRHRAVAELHRRSERYSQLFESPDEFLAYLVEMSALGTWGDELVLRAIADSYGAALHVVTSSEENWYLVYSPACEEGSQAAASEPPDAERPSETERPRRNVFLTYLSPVHYNGFEERPLQAADVRVRVSS